MKVLWIAFGLLAHIINLPYRFLILKHVLNQWARWS